MFTKTNREPIDGIDTLKRRERTRLWYRQQPKPVETASPLEVLANGKPVSAVRIVKAELAPAPVGTDRLVRESVSLSANLQKALEQVGEESGAPSSPQDKDALTAWRDAPMHCPVLLLSASPLLDARNPGPILGPGTRYRIMTLNDGVAALEVAALDGQVGAGYCNSIDLTCVEPNIANLRREGGANVRQTARLSLNRISQRLSGVTAALVG
jgi:hypothetical protein